jgi:hypothetical protein
VAVGAGVVGVGLGAFFGLRAQSKNDDSLALCRPDDPSRCTAEGKSLRDDAAGAATVSTIGFVAGGALLAGGVVLLLTAPGAEEPRVAARPRRTGPRYSLRVTPGGLSFGGSF